MGCTVVWCLALFFPLDAMILSRYPRFLPLSKNMNIRLVGDSELTLGVSVHGCCYTPSPPQPRIGSISYAKQVVG